jgi:transcriptional regulator with XRE-family HTH domain
MRRTKTTLVASLAKVMHDARKEKGFTQSFVAGHIGISQGALSKMERGLLVPSAIQWVEFCRLTRTRVDAFMPPVKEQ